MNPQDIRTLVNRLTLLEAGEPENPSRRGFLRKAAGAAAIAAAPSSLLTGIGNTAASAAKGIATDIAKGIGQYITQTSEEISVRIPVNRMFGGIMVDSIDMFISPDPENGDGYLRVSHSPTTNIPYVDNTGRFEKDLKNFLKEKGFDPSAVEGIDFNEGGEQEEDAASFDANEFADSIRSSLGITTPEPVEDHLQVAKMFNDYSASMLEAAKEDPEESEFYNNIAKVATQLAKIYATKGFDAGTKAFSWYFMSEQGWAEDFLNKIEDKFNFSIDDWMKNHEFYARGSGGNANNPVWDSPDIKKSAADQATTSLGKFGMRALMTKLGKIASFPDRAEKAVNDFEKGATDATDKVDRAVGDKPLELPAPSKPNIIEPVVQPEKDKVPIPLKKKKQ